MIISTRSLPDAPSRNCRRWMRRTLIALTGFVAAAPVAAQGSLGASSHIAVVNGIELHYRMAGTGQPLLLLHGYGWSGEQWDRFIPALAEDFRLLIPDMRGHGRSSMPPGNFLQRDVAADMLALLDLLGLTKIAAVGHSGGANALYLAAAVAPERFASLVVIGAQHEFTDQNRMAMQATPDLEGLPEPVRRAMMRAHPGGRPQIDWLLAQFRQLGANRDDLNLTLDRLSQIQARVLIIAGDREEVGLALREKRSIPGASLWVVPSQGHFPFWDDFGGSALAAEFFPRLMREFVGTGVAAAR
ncbi:MAG TPA: alpha/beta fold hydrolase [Longimicrobiaceae bacterium]